MLSLARRAIALLATAVVAAGGLTAAAVPAQATGTATISRSIYLADSSTGQAFLPYGADREIYLAAATYTWTHTLDGFNLATRTIYLESAWYNWGCTLTGTGVSSANGYNYQGYCWLDERASQTGPVISEATDPYNGTTYLSMPLNRTVTWQSQLTG